MVSLRLCERGFASLFVLESASAFLGVGIGVGADIGGLGFMEGVSLEIMR